MKKWLFTKKNIKRCCYILIPLLLLQYFLYYTQKYNFINNTEQKIISKAFLNSNDKIDWENTTFIEHEAKRVGPGEQGKPYSLTDPEEIKENEVLFKREGFYVGVSDKISSDRALPDMRPES